MGEGEGEDLFVMIEQKSNMFANTKTRGSKNIRELYILRILTLRVVNHENREEKNWHVYRISSPGTAEDSLIVDASEFSASSLG